MNQQRSQSKLWWALKRGTLLLAGGLVVGIGMSVSAKLQADRTVPHVGIEANREIARLGNRVEELEGQYSVTELKLQRLNRVLSYSAAYRIPADLAVAIYDAALAEGLHPSLGFQLVKVESGFKANARSSKSAIGLAQVRLATAQEVDPDVTYSALLEPATNLRIGFRILRGMLRQFDNDLKLALRAYNLGPTGAVEAIVDSAGALPGAAYAERVMRGMKRRLAPLPEAGSGTP